MRSHGLHEGCVMFSPAATGVASRMVAAAAMTMPYQSTDTVQLSSTSAVLQLQHARDDYGEARRWFGSMKIAADTRRVDASSWDSVCAR